MGETTNEALLNNLLHEVENDCGNGADTYSERVMQARAAVLARMVMPQGRTRGGQPWTDEHEAAARKVYESFKHLRGYVPWVEGGNSDKQEEARDLVMRCAPSAQTCESTP